MTRIVFTNDFNGNRRMQDIPVWQAFNLCLHVHPRMLLRSRVEPVLGRFFKFHSFSKSSPGISFSFAK